MKRITRTGEVSVLTADSGRNSLGGGLVASVGACVPEAYPFRLNTYARPPDYEITIEQFEEWAFARLQLLRAVENASLRHQREDELSKAIKTAEEKWMPLHSNESAAAYPLFEERRKDQASHYILRLAFCSSPSSISWFIAQECLLFRIRFHNELGRERADFLKRCNAHLRPVEEEERTQQPLLDLLRRSSPGKEGDEFYKVPFELVPDLVARRGCLVRGGYAYVPKSDSFSIVMTRFRENLEFWVERTSRELTTLKDERLLPLLQLVKTSEAAAAAAAHPSDAARGFVEGRLTAADIDAASVHFPLCMLQLYQRGKQDNHLRYGGRQQLGLFFKSIGVSLEEAIVFWRRLFVPKCGEDGFTKNYLYNIRHNYGQEGKRANYGPNSCSRIITTAAPGPLEHHGCPFRHASADSLTTMLVAHVGPTGGRLEGGQVQEIVELARGNHCQSACTRLFEYTRHQQAGQLEIFSYPSKYFEASLRLTKRTPAPVHVPQ